jgi:acyl-CoA thioesterase-1
MRQRAPLLASLVGLGVIVGVFAPAPGRDAPATTRRTKPNAEALAPITEDPTLPRVLLLGDSISIGYTLPTRALLQGKANLIHAKDNCNDTSNGLKMLDTWLGSRRWDVIHFNFGLHDLKYVSDETRPNARRQNIPLEQYEQNLEQIVQRLKKTGAKLIWCMTTPVPAGAADRIEGGEKRYNETAARVMGKYHIPIDDLWALARKHQDQWQLPHNVHFTDEGYQALAAQVNAAIENELESK